MKPFKSKRGIIIEFIALLIFCVGFIVVLVAMAGPLNNLAASYGNDTAAPNVTKNLMKSNSNKYVKMVDSGFLMFFVMMALFVIISAALIDSSPLFMVASILGLVVMLFLGVFIANVISDYMVTVPDAARFPIISHIVNNMLLYLLFIGALAIIALAAKKGVSG